MALFGRRKSSEASDEVELAEPETGEADQDVAHEEVADDTSEKARSHRARLRPRDDVDLSNGPYDRDDMPEGDILDFGAMAIAPPENAEVRLDVDEESQAITGMTVVMGADGSAAVQLQAFAAPKTSGIWYGIRREIAEALIASGGSADEVDGELGVELHVRMPHQGPDGRSTFSPARFVGIDGPRWFLRAVLSGEAAVDEQAAERAMRIVRSVGIRRGQDPRAPRELLELTIPQELMQNSEASSQDAEQAGIERMERGPEITETR